MKFNHIALSEDLLILALSPILQHVLRPLCITRSIGVNYVVTIFSFFRSLNERTFLRSEYEVLHRGTIIKPGINIYLL